MMAMSLVLVGVLVLIFVAMVNTTRKNRDELRTPPEKLDIDLAVSNVTYRFGTEADPARIFVMGEIANEFALDALDVVIRVNLWDSKGTLIDSFLDRPDDFRALANTKSRFRVDALTPATPSDIAKIEATIERSRARTRFD